MVYLAADERPHLIITLHGIRTYGSWQQRLEKLVAATPGAEQIGVINFKFNYFSVVAFLIPFFRWIVVLRFRRELRRLCRIGPRTRIDLVGHSFGTHVLAWALLGLDRSEPIQIHTIILSGSVLRSGFPWRDLIGSRVRRVINDCGSRDKILLLSQFFVLFTGMSGRHGFGGSTSDTFRNRFSVFGHGGYFTDDRSGDPDAYMRSRWLPLLVGVDPAIDFDYRDEPTVLGGIILALGNNAEPLKIVLYATPFVALALWMYEQRNTAISSALLAQARAEQAIEPGGLDVLSYALASERYATNVGARSLVATQTRLLAKRTNKLVTTLEAPEVGLEIGGASVRLMSPDGEFLLARAAHSLVVYDRHSSKKVAELPIEPGDETGGALAAGGGFLALIDTTLRVISTATGNAIAAPFNLGTLCSAATDESSGHPLTTSSRQCGVTGLAITRDGRFALLVVEHKNAFQIDIRSGSSRHLISGAIEDVAIADNVPRSAIAVRGTGIFVFLENGTQDFLPVHRDRRAGQVAFDSTGRFLAGGLGPVRVWEVMPGRMLEVAHVPTKATVEALGFADSGKSLELIGFHTEREVWDLTAALAYRDAALVRHDEPTERYVTTAGDFTVAWRVGSYLAVRDQSGSERGRVELGNEVLALSIDEASARITGWTSVDRNVGWTWPTLAPISDPLEDIADAATRDNGALIGLRYNTIFSDGVLERSFDETTALRIRGSWNGNNAWVSGDREYAALMTENVEQASELELLLNPPPEDGELTDGFGGPAVESITVEVVRVRDHRRLRITLDSFDILSLQMNREGNILVLANDEEAHVVDLTRWHVSRTMNIHYATSVVMDPDGRWFAACGSSFKIFSINSGEKFIDLDEIPDCSHVARGFWFDGAFHVVDDLSGRHRIPVDDDLVLNGCRLVEERIGRPLDGITFGEMSIQPCTESPIATILGVVRRWFAFG